jgi:hypothetical protein
MHIRGCLDRIKTDTLVDKSNYCVKKGSISVVFKPTLIEILLDGKHFARIVSTFASTCGTPEIRERNVQQTEQATILSDTTPKTGEGSRHCSGLALLFVFAGGLIVLICRKRLSQQGDNIKPA